MFATQKKPFITVIGESSARKEIYNLALEVGRLIAQKDAVLICGGLRGVMEAVCKGAKAEGGTTIGILPGSNREDANPYVDYPIVTGIGYARNKLVVKSGQVVIAIGGSYGTLSEMAFALGYRIPVIGLRTWKLVKNEKFDQKVIVVNTAQEAVTKAFEIIKRLPKTEKIKEFRS